MQIQAPIYNHFFFSFFHKVLQFIFVVMFNIVQFFVSRLDAMSISHYMVRDYQVMCKPSLLLVVVNIVSLITGVSNHTYLH